MVLLPDEWKAQVARRLNEAIDLGMFPIVAAGQQAQGNERLGDDGLAIRPVSI